MENGVLEIATLATTSSFYSANRLAQGADALCGLCEFNRPLQ